LLDRPGGADRDTFLGKRSATGGLYVFSLEPWNKRPSDLLYIGSGHSTDNTTLRHRIGAEVIASLGFSGGTGGVLLCEYCREKKINPLDLFVAWQILKSCPVPDEQRLYDIHKGELSPKLLNRRRPGRCGRC